MRLILENEFTWDGLYGILDEHGKERYVVDAALREDIRRAVIYPCTLDELNAHNALMESDPQTEEERIAVASEKFNKKYQMAAIVWEKRHVSRSKYTIEVRDRAIGTIERSFLSDTNEYDVELKGMMVSGNVYDWNFIIVNKKETVARSTITGNRLSLEYDNDDYELTLAMLLVALSGLAYDLRVASMQVAAGKSLSQREPIAVPKFLKGGAEGSGLEEAIGLVMDGVEKVTAMGRRAVKTGNKAVLTGKKAARIGKKGLAAGEKIIEKIFLSETPEEEKEK